MHPIDCHDMLTPTTLFPPQNLMMQLLNFKSRVLLLLIVIASPTVSGRHVVAADDVAGSDANQASTTHSQWRPLLGSTLDGWEVFTGVPHRSVVVGDRPQSSSEDGRTGTPIGLGDPLGIYTFDNVDGQTVLHVSGQVYAALTTTESFDNYHFSLDYKWGEKKWPPRADRKRDSGVLIHCTGEHGAFWNVWMRSIECQVQETDAGDLYALGGTSVRATAETTDGGFKTYSADGDEHSIGNGSGGGKISRSENHEIPGDWNHVDVMTVGDQGIFMVNGHVVMRYSNARQGDQMTGKPLTGGRIQIQSEAAEVFYKNIRLRSIEELPLQVAASGAGSPRSSIHGLSAIQGNPSKIHRINVSNDGETSTKVTASFAGESRDYFRLASPTPASCDAGQSIEIDVAFQPPANFVGIANATLQVKMDDEVAIEHSLRGLSTRGLEGKNEAALADVLQTLGYRVDIGWKTLANHVKPAKVGDEIQAVQFRKAEPGNVDLIPVARYSPSFELPFGYYTSGSTDQDPSLKPVLNQVGVLSGDKNYPEHQTLDPALQEGGTTFDPGDEAFGIYTTSPTHDAYSADVWNSSLHEKNAAHACRIYAARDDNAKAMENQYIFCFEEAFNGDYQDYVFLVKNIQPIDIATMSDL